MQPFKDVVEHLVAGAIIYHQPRNHYYRIMNKTMIKSGDKGWEYGWSYVEVDKAGETQDELNFTWKTDAEVYSRPFSMFDSDWHLAY